jgi:hypothetical protein
MSSIEFTYWCVYLSIEPFGYIADSNRAGQIAAAVVNVTRTKKSDMVKPADFYPVPPRRKSKVLTERQKQQLEKRRKKNV